MSPIALPQDLANETWEPKDGFTLIEPGIYDATIFAVARKSNDKGNYYQVTFRIQGGDFDGEDVIEQYVGLQKDTIFRLYDILKGADLLAPYYDEANKKWIALPTDDELVGKSVYIQLDNAPFQSRDKDTKQLLFNTDGTPKMLDSTKPTRYFPRSEPKPEYKPRRVSPGAPPAQAGQPVQQGNVTAGAAAAQTQQGGAAPSADTPW